MFFKNFIIKRFNHLSNTNETAKNMIKSGACVAIVANNMDYGKTQKGYDWLIKQGNLYMSIGINAPIANNIQYLVFLTAIAVGNVIQNYQPKYKWPNDIFINGKKVCGILIERENTKVIIGIGLNVASSPEYATYLNKYKTTELEGLPEAILNQLQNTEQNLHSPTLIKSTWESHAMFLNENINFYDGAKMFSGIFIGIDATGKLMLKSNNKTLLFSYGSICINT